MLYIAPNYRVFQRRGLFYVIVTNSAGVEYDATKGTDDKTLAERWCRDLRRRAQVESDRVGR